MQLATFRTEYAFDGDRARSLVDAMGLVIVKDYILGDKDRPHVSVHVFTIKVPDGVSVSEVKEKMETFVEHDPRFADLHRCEQTLQEGEDYKEPWYDVPETAPVIQPIPLEFKRGKSSPYCSEVRAEMYQSGQLVMTPAYLTTQAILQELDDRRGIGRALDMIDDDVRDEIADAMTGIIETMYPEATATPNMSFFNRVMHEVNS